MRPRAGMTVEQLHLHTIFMAYQSLPKVAATALQVSGWFLTGVAIASGIAASLPAETRAETVLSSFVTTGADLSGAQVTASFLDGGSETLVWQATGEASGGVFGHGWSLGQRLDSFSYPWLLEVNEDAVIYVLSINLLEGNALFDVEASVAADVNTLGSKVGAAFSIKPESLVGDGGEPNRVSYDLPIDISQGDLFAELRLEWENGFGDGALEFIADTDSGTVTNPVRLVNAPAEPPQAIAIPLVPPDRVAPPTAVSIPLAPPDRVASPKAVLIPLAPPDRIASLPQSVPEPDALLALFGLVGLLGTRVVVTMSRQA